jgi:predicted RND superfamily exporter protein
MGFWETLAYVYFGCPRGWRGSPVSGNKRFLIKTAALFAGSVVCLLTGLAFALNGRFLIGIVSLCFVIAVWTLHYREFKKRGK